MVFPGLADFRDVVIPRALTLEEARLPHGLLLSCVQIRGGLTLTGAHVGGLTVIEVPFPGQILAHAAEFAGNVSIHVLAARAVLLASAKFTAGVELRGRFPDRVIFDQATIRGLLNLSDCNFFGALSFKGTRFEPPSEIDLRGTVFRRDFNISAPLAAPRVMRLDDTFFRSHVEIATGLGKAALRLVARDHSPRFGGEVVFTNVDLGECRLLGNDIGQIELNNARWGRRFGRTVLFDEILLRRGAEVPLHSLKDAYQVLKTKYHAHGDYATAGCFHYGEMEMKRRELGWPRRVLSREFVYWALSGYGTSYARALLGLIAVILLFAGLYWWSGSWRILERFFEALRFRIAVSVGTVV
jgi:hypothetical protein